MAINVTADPQRFNEAAEWFSKRVVLTRDEAVRLGDDAGRRAFWIGGGLQLQQIQRVFDKLNQAIEDSEPFEEWRKRVKSELRDDAHAETVFRNATQRALNAGRYRQMREPGVLAFRPYGLFDGIDDSRQSEICAECDGTILPLDHPWWLTHTPLLHHRCRSSVRGLRKSEALRRGVTNVPTLVEADKGFGHSPDSEPVWKPDPAKTDPALRKELERKASTGRKKKAPPKAPPPIHDPKHWEAEYSKQYGEAAAPVAWGRAMLERGLDRSAGDVGDELERLQKAGHPSLAGADGTKVINAIRAVDSNRPLRGTLLGQQHQHLVALSEHTRTITPGPPMTLAGPSSLPRSTRAFYDLSLDESVQRPNDWRIKVAGDRSGASPVERLITMRTTAPDRVWTHEIAHATEDANPKTLQRSLAYVRARTKGEKLVSLRKLTGLPFREDEMSRPDKFLSPYMGKDYGAFATEVTSMGYEWLHADGQMLDRLARDDFDSMLFLLGQLAGR